MLQIFISAWLTHDLENKATNKESINECKMVRQQQQQQQQSKSPCTRNNKLYLKKTDVVTLRLIFGGVTSCHKGSIRSINACK